MIRLWVAGLLLLLLAAPAAPASAHAGLLVSNPTPGEVVRSPLTELRLVFDGQLLGGSVEVSVTDPRGRAVDVGTPVVSGTEVLVPVGAFRRPGDHVLGWRVVGGDDHPETGEVPFRVARSAVAPDGTPSGGGAAVAAAALADTGPARGVPAGWIWFGGLLVCLAVTPKLVQRHRAHEGSGP